MSKKLKPCPACGGEADFSNAGNPWVYCTSCEMTGPCTDTDGARWNSLPRRTDAKAPAGMGDAELIARAIRALCVASVDESQRSCGELEHYTRAVDAELARREKERQT